MKIAIGQINSTIGDFSGNREKMVRYAEEAKKKGANCIVFPEMALCGYPPMDLFDYPSFVEENLKNLRMLQKELPQDIAAAIGYVEKNRECSGKSLLNAVSVIYNGKVIHTQAKTLLPTYDVFDEARYFEPARQRVPFYFNGSDIGIALCEDIWWETEPAPGTRYPIDPVHDLMNGGADIILVPSASPYFARKWKQRLHLAERIGKSQGVPVVYVNMVGGNDSLIFDGHSFATDLNGKSTLICRGFEEDLQIYDTENVEGGATRNTASDKSPAEDGGSTTYNGKTRESGFASGTVFYKDKYGELKDALVLGLRDYLSKCGFTRVHMGLSGGIDSALTAVIAADAIGPENVALFGMPSRYSSEGSKTDAAKLAENLGCEFTEIPIESMFSSFIEGLSPVFEDRAPDVTEENIQARIRGTILMAYSNKFNSLLLATGNKSELAVGYCTLYGDMAGGLAPIGDLFKEEVFALSGYINRHKEIIPREILEKPPSAELRPDQKDEDSLPPYDILDAILDYYLLGNKTIEDIISDGYDRETVYYLLKLVGRAEYKRRQAPPVLKVSPRAFGTGRRMPIARKLFEVNA